MRPLPAAPAAVSIRLAARLLSRSPTTIVKMLTRGDLARGNNRHVSTASIGVLLGHEVSSSEHAHALALLRAGGKR